MRRRIKLRRKFFCDVLIFDTIGVNWLSSCIPKYASTGNLETRFSLPMFLSLSYLFRLIVEAIRCVLKKQTSLSAAYLTALICEIDPKVILTCSDNNVILSKLAKCYPELPVIFVQLSLRDDKGTMPSNLNLPIYFSLGHVEQQMYRRLNTRCLEFIPVGSVKLGLALQHRDNGDPKGKGNDICFISHYRPELIHPDASSLSQQVESAHRRLYFLTVQYANNRRLPLTILSKTRSRELQSSELEYFERISASPYTSFVTADKNVNELSTYKAMFQSGLVVNLASTLGFEALAIGKKVLFGATEQHYLRTNWGCSDYFVDLPDLVVLSTDSQAEFNEKVNNLLHLPNHDYQNAIGRMSTNVVAMPQREYPHEKIRKKIESCLSACEKKRI